MQHQSLLTKYAPYRWRAGYKGPLEMHVSHEFGSRDVTGEGSWQAWRTK